MDCLTTWLARVMDDCGAWDGDAGCRRAVAARLDRLLVPGGTPAVTWSRSATRSAPAWCPDTPSGRRFRDELGQLNTRIAAASDEVWLCTAGIARRLR